MNVQNREVLGMATLGGYDPNNYLEIGDPAVQQELDRLKGAYSTLQEGSEAYDKAVNAYQEAWLRPGWPVAQPGGHRRLRTRLHL